MKNKNIYVYEIPYRNKKGKKRKVLHVPDSLYKYIMYAELIITVLTFAALCFHIISSQLYYVMFGVIWATLFPVFFFVETDTMKKKREDFLNKEKE